MASLNEILIPVLIILTGINCEGKRCPDPKVIAPCICKEYAYPPTEFDCSNVTSNDELTRIFNSITTRKDFGRLIISGNKHLQTIRIGDLGICSFEEIRITGGSLVKLDPWSLAGNFDTVATIALYSNHLESFPFDELIDFKVLRSLAFESNNFTLMPKLHSDSLRFLNFGNNKINGPLPANVFQKLPSLNYITLSECNLTEILPGTFTGLSNLTSVDVERTNIKKLSSGTFTFKLDKESRLWLNNNELEEIEPGAFTGVGGSVYAINCGLKVLEEDVWKPTLENGAYLSIQKNDFECGCDMAWLVLNTTFMTRVHPTTACADGTLFTDLDPEDFKPCINATLLTNQ